MDQQDIRDYEGVRYSKEEGAAIIKELDDRTKYSDSGYNSMQSLGEKMKVVEEQAAGAISGYRGPIAIADTPTEDGVYTPTETGTYTNAGSLLYAPDTTDNGKIVQFIKTGATWVKNSIENLTTSDIDNTTGKAITAKAVKDYSVAKTDFFDYQLLLDSSILTIDGFIRIDGTESTSSSYKKSALIDITTFGNVIKVRNRLASTSAVVCAFYDISDNFISASPRGGTTDLTIYNINVPANATKARFVCNTLDIANFYVGANNLSKFDVANLRIDELENQTTVNNVFFANNSVFEFSEFMRPNGTTTASPLYRRSDFIEISGISKIYIHTVPGSVSVSPCVFFDESYTYISGVTPVTTIEQDFVIDVPSNAKYIVTSIVNTGISLFQMNVDISVSGYISLNGNKKQEVFISTLGNDSTGTGTEQNPFLTYGKAAQLVSENGNVICKEGDYLLSSGLNISTNILAKSGERVRFIFGTKFTTATLEGGYTKVYSTPYATAINASNYLWQHDIEDVDTEILSSERHPLHRGKTYRLSSTRIYPASSIAEIESTTDRLMWFADGTKLYFSKSSGSDLTVNPIIIPSGTGLTLQGNSDLLNISCLYAPIITNGRKSNCKYLSVGFTNSAGSLVYDNTIGLEFENCEFFGCLNDGANGHSATPNKTFSNVTSAIFKDCWFHDNSDDGESCHEYSQTTHYGSLVEYNGNGITPASGGHSVCHNCTARRNGNNAWSVGQEGTGFSAQGTPIDGGASTDVWCYGCFSENNGVGFKAQNEGNTFVNCISKDDTVAFSGTSNQINCVTI
jgi:hypothetical protein